MASAKLLVPGQKGAAGGVVGAGGDVESINQEGSQVRTHLDYVTQPCDVRHMTI